MEYQEAVKKIQAKKPKENFMVIETGYNTKIILPYKDGVSFMNTLANAEQFFDSYGDKRRIGAIERESIKSHLMSCEEYEHIKIANLLNIPVEDVRAMAT